MHHRQRERRHRHRSSDRHSNWAQNIKKIAEVTGLNVGDTITEAVGTVLKTVLEGAKAGTLRRDSVDSVLDGVDGVAGGIGISDGQVLQGQPAAPVCVAASPVSGGGVPPL